ncbi:uncharacterized protein LOC124910352 [Impatiens glandulifera]|uniref:uncharacterized protein LOC124910352 n=1 Tax=Impatiens glandulifera TaxID=253017 RepID=UPI001FB1263D|nr:uncharacterized protein LOC124910352 [Impatiens glandulifera]
MVSLFSRFSISRSSHRRTQSALDGREEVVPISEPTAAAATATVLATGGVGVTTITSAGHGLQLAVEFKPVDHPTEPLDHDIPIQCPLPEPSILNDGRLWKERVSVGVRRITTDTPSVEGGNTDESVPKPKSRPPSRRLILPSSSAPEHNILKLLEESGI